MCMSVFAYLCGYALLVSLVPREQYCDRSYRFELQMAVSHPVGTGNRTHVLKKKKKKLVLFLAPDVIILRITWNCMIYLIIITF